MSHVSDDGLLHFSTLKNINQSPMHLDYYRRHGLESTDAMLKGSAFHALALQGIAPKVWEGRRSGNAYKAAVAANGGEALLTEAHAYQVRAMVDALRMSRLAQAILARCPNREKYITWERNGVKCGGTLDASGPDDLAELKSTKSAHPIRFQRQAKFELYPEQVEWYETAEQRAFDGLSTKWRNCWIIAVESKAPYAVSVHRIAPLRLLQAHNTIDDWLDKYKLCDASGEFPGWDAEECTIDGEVPGWDAEECTIDGEVTFGDDDNSDEEEEENEP